MRLCALFLTGCVHAASLPSTLPNCLDIQGQRELLAGVALEAGEQAAALAACNVQKRAAQQEAQSNEWKATWLPVITGIAGAVLSAAVTAGIEAGVQKEEHR